MKVPFKCRTASAKATERALIDSGATENFVDNATWQRMGVGRSKLPRPLRLLNVNSTENRQGEVTHRCCLRIKYNDKEDVQDFFIANLGKDRIILGYPFLRVFNP